MPAKRELKRELQAQPKVPGKKPGTPSPKVQIKKNPGKEATELKYIKPGEKRELDNRESIKVVTSNHFITAAGLERISLKARKLLYIAISQCRQDDTEFYEFAIKPSEFAEFMNIEPSNIYATIDSITDELMRGFIKYVPDGEEKFIKFSLFDICEYTKDKEIRFRMSRKMTPILLNLKENFSQPLLNDFLKMKSNYSMEVWHLMQREMHSRKPNISEKIYFSLSLEELRQATGTTEKFKQLSQFKEKVLDKAIREIRDNCGVGIEYRNIKRGRTVVAFEFTAKHEYHTLTENLSETQKHRTILKAKLMNMAQKKKCRPLTPEEQEEYRRMIEDCKQLNLDDFLERNSID